MALFGKNGVRRPRIGVRPSGSGESTQMDLEFAPSSGALYVRVREGDVEERST
jgi:hypothetical protein